MIGLRANEIQNIYIGRRSVSSFMLGFGNGGAELKDFWNRSNIGEKKVEVHVQPQKDDAEKASKSSAGNSSPLALIK